MLRCARRPRELARARETARRDEVETLIAAAVSAGKIAPVSKDLCVARAMAGKDGPMANVASTMFRDANVTLPPASLTAEATIVFNDLATRVSDVSDPDEIAAAMPLVEYSLKRRLKDATANPGAGKCGA